MARPARIDLNRSGAALKRCPCCGLFKARTHYWLRRQAKDGLHAYCIDCGRKKNKLPKKTHKSLVARIHDGGGHVGSIDADLAAAHASDNYHAMMALCEAFEQRALAAGLKAFTG